MAWVSVIGPEQATGELAELYAGLPGDPDGIVLGHSLAHHLQLGRHGLEPLRTRRPGAG